MKRNARIVAIDDEAPMLRIIRRTMEREGHRVETFLDAEEALAFLRSEAADIVVTDMMMPGADGFKVLDTLRLSGSDTAVVVITAFATVETAIRAMKQGAADFIPKPFDPEHLLLVTRRIVEQMRLKEENLALRRRLANVDGLDAIIGTSAAIRAVKEMIVKVRDTDGTVLITGESGTGKELVARAIHAGSSRRERPLMTINCAALPDELLESELFGYEPGAFTGATARKKGLLETADGGTVFLDEVGNVSAMMQVKLLRFLQERSFLHLGGKDEIRVDIRIVAATNADLAEGIRNGLFRRDLFFRLNVLPVHLPSLRERREDIPLLARHFLAKFAGRTGRVGLVCAKDAEAALLHHPWEGNVRELENVMERAATLAPGPQLSVVDLLLGQPAALSQARSEACGIRLDRSLAQVEEEYICAVLQETAGNKTQAARILGVDYSTLLRRLKALAGD